MNTTKKLAALTVLALTLATPSLFADNRRHETTDGWRGRSNQSRRVTVEGVVRDIDRDRNGFVIRLDRGYTLVAEREDMRGLRGLERGDFIRATGYLDRGRVFVNDIDLVRGEDRRGGADDRYLTGIVQNVDRRGNVIWVELNRSNRVVAVDVRRVDRNSRRFDVDDVRRGDRITVRGDWQRNGRFEAERVDVDRGAQW
ncbi:MAG: hypothetical protein ACJ74H_10955 [Thermoanaerobaculia bacterium]